MKLSPLERLRQPDYPIRGKATKVTVFIRRTVACTAGIFVLSCGGGTTYVEVPLAPPESVVDEEESTNVDASAAPGRGESWEEWANLPLQIIFDVGSTSLDDSSKELLGEFASMLGQRDDITRVRVIGHSHSRRGFERDPEVISQSRALVVVEFLVDEFGMDRDLFEALGRGGEEPRLSGDVMLPVSDPSFLGRVNFQIAWRRSVSAE